MITQLTSGAHGRGVQIVDSAEQTFPYKDSVPRYAGDVTVSAAPAPGEKLITMHHRSNCPVGTTPAEVSKICTASAPARGCPMR
jgi:hypothetical protein